MTDPRVAALAEALHAERVGCAFSLPRKGQTEPVALCIKNGIHDSQAPRLLAALPPDWCGHDGLNEIDDAYREGVADGRLGQNWRERAEGHEATIARLRRIEEAARALADEVATERDLEWPRAAAALDALRAALEDGVEGETPVRMIPEEDER